MAPISGALQAAHNIMLFELVLQLRNGESELVLDSAIHVDDVSVCIEVGNWSMIPVVSSLLSVEARLG